MENKIKEMLALNEKIYRSKSWKIRKQLSKQLKAMEIEYFKKVDGMNDGKKTKQ